MEDLCKRIPLVAGMILKKLDNQTLVICKESSRVLWQYLDEEKLVSIRIIKEYKKFFLQFQERVVLVARRDADQQIESSAGRSCLGVVVSQFWRRQHTPTYEQ